MSATIITLFFLALPIAALMRYAPRWADTRATRPSAEEIDAVLPQTQCTLCSYSGCRPYADAIARGEADINQCPPGGEAGIRALAKLLRVKPKPLNPKHGPAKIQQTIAVIDEASCIGCTLCIQACPVDAILGASKQMHTVIAMECTGCELCIAPCPVDCISMVAEPQESAGHGFAAAYYSRSIHHQRAKKKANNARRRHQSRLLRLEREKVAHDARLNEKLAEAATLVTQPDSSTDRQSAILASIERARAKREGRLPNTTSITQSGEGNLRR